MVKNMATFKNFWTSLFKRRVPQVDVEIMRYTEEAAKPLIGPKEELFTPARSGIGDKLNLDGYELPGVTYRVAVNKTQASVVPEAPPSFTGLTYSMEQFQIGVDDGYKGISPKHNLDNLPFSHEINKALSFPLRPYERIAAAEAKKVWLDLGIEQHKNELEKSDQTEKELRQRLESLRKLRAQRLQDEIEFEQQQARNSQQRLLNAGDEPAPVVKEKDDSASHQNVLVRLITGLFLTVCGLIFMVADIALSIAAIYALGFQDIEGVRWSEAIFNTSLWKTHWEGVFVCLGFAAITIFFKYAYDRLVHSTKPFKLYERIIFGLLAVACTTTVIFLGVLRADYLLKNMEAASQVDASAIVMGSPEQKTPAVPDSTQPALAAKEPQEFFGVNRQIAFWAMLLTTVLFPLLGGVALSEGLSRTFGGLGEVLHKVAQPFGRLTKKFTTVVQGPAPTVLDKETNALDARISQLDQHRKQIREELNNAEREKFLIDQLLPIWREAIEVYKGSLGAMAELERLLYLHGYEQGKMLRGSEGAYKFVTGVHANELAHRSNGDLLELTNGKTNGEKNLVYDRSSSLEGV